MLDDAMDLASSVKVYAATGLNGLEISEGKIVAYLPEGADDTDRLWDEIEVITILDSQLKSLPPLPSGLKELNCFSCQLKTLPPLPDGLSTVNCIGNRLTSLPDLPRVLWTLDCSENGLESLPPLPKGLVFLFCEANRLTSLPKLPEGLEVLDCRNNRLATLPPLPNSLKTLECTGNPFSRGVCREDVPVGLRSKIPEEVYEIYDKSVAFWKAKFGEALGAIPSKPFA